MTPTQSAPSGDLNPLIDIVQMLRETAPSMTLNQLVTLLFVMRDEGITQSSIIDMTGLTDASASRISAILGPYGNRGTPPLNLIQMVEHPEDRRVRHLHLTNTGRSLKAAILGLLRSLRHGQATQR